MLSATVGFFFHRSYDHLDLSFGIRHAGMDGLIAGGVQLRRHGWIERLG